MSSITDVVIILGGCFDGEADVINAEITKYLTTQDHQPLLVVQVDGGGEKVMTSSLLIGAFNCLSIDLFKQFLKNADWKTIGHCGSIMLSYQHEDDCQWTAFPVWDDPLC